MTAELDRSLLARRLVIVTGKGGTGKTSVSAALALVAARAGRRVMVIEVGASEEIPTLLSPGAAPVGYAGRELLPGLSAMRIDPFEALAEYLTLRLHIRGVVDRTLRTRAFRQLMEASPGWRELITLGKVWHLEQMRDDAGRERYDLLVVDAPATGHGLTFLDVPRVVGSAVRAGPLRRSAALVEQMIRDRERTLLLPVALAEELPTRESVELVRRVRADIGIAVDRVIVNAVAPAPFPQGLADLDQRLARLPETSVGGLEVTALSHCAAWFAERHALNTRYLAEIGRETGLPTVCLPRLLHVRGPDDLEKLAHHLVADVPAASL